MPGFWNSPERLISGSLILALNPAIIMAKLKSSFPIGIFNFTANKYEIGLFKTTTRLRTYLLILLPSFVTNILVFLVLICQFFAFQKRIYPSRFIDFVVRTWTFFCKLVSFPMTILGGAFKLLNSLPLNLYFFNSGEITTDIPFF